MTSADVVHFIQALSGGFGIAMLVMLVALIIYCETRMRR